MDISERALREVFLKPYVLAINSGVGSLMVAHHEVNGIPCHMNKYLLQDILVNELDFRGVIISDWMDVERLFKLHNVARSKKEASLLSVNAGIDVNMHGPDFFENILSLVKENIISEERIEKSVKKILKLKFDLGLFDNPFSNNSIDNQILYQNSHKNTSLDVARRSIVLLKNNKLLPLKKVKENKNILVTGPNANNHSILGDWTLNQPENRVKTIFEGIKEDGLSETFKNAQGAFGEAKKRAALDVNKVGGNMAKAINVYLAQQAVGAQGLLSRATGAILNPNLEMLFGGPKLRSFGFTFKLSPRDASEASQVRQIIRFFKQNMSPQKGGGSGGASANLFLKAPNTFQIHYMHKGTEEHPFIGRPKECAMTSFEVDYTPDGNYSTLRDGFMTSYTISMSLKELEPVFYEDYEELNNPNIIGY